MADWEGDTTKDAEKNPSMGNDDYKADLDAVNIIQRMEDKNQSYLEASNAYYSELESGKTNRAQEFVDNEDINNIKFKIFNSLVPENNHGKVYIPKSEEEKMTYLKDHYPDSYNFIRSLEEEKNSMKDYVG